MVEHLSLEDDELRDLMLELVSSRSIVEIEYVINNKSRSFFVPGNTDVNVVKVYKI